MILLRAYGYPGGIDVVSEWFAQANATATANLDARMIYLRPLERDKGWVRNYYDTLRDADGVGEVRWKAEKINYRGLGYFGPKRNEFTFLLFCTKTDEYKPRNSIAVAVERKKEVEANPKLSVLITGRWNQ